MRYDRIDSPRRRMPSRRQSRTLLAIGFSFLVFLFAASGESPFVLSGLLVLPFLWLVQRLVRGSLNPRTLRGGSVVRVADRTGHDDPPHDAAADAGRHALDGSSATDGAVPVSPPSEIEGLSPDMSVAPGEISQKLVRVRESRRNPRKPLPEPPAARFVMVAPGRYVRVEEVGVTPVVPPSTGDEPTEEPPPLPPERLSDPLSVDGLGHEKSPNGGGGGSDESDEPSERQGMGDVNDPSHVWQSTVGLSEERQGGDVSRAATGSRPVTDPVSGGSAGSGTRMPPDREPRPGESQPLTANACEPLRASALTHGPTSPTAGVASGCSFSAGPPG